MSSACLLLWEIMEPEEHGFESGAHGFETWSCQTKDFKIDTCRFLPSHMALIGLGNDWLALCQDNVTEWDSRSFAGGMVFQ